MWSCVTWNVWERITGLVRRSNASGSQQEEEPAEAEEERVESQLFHCPDCDVTFISREMRTCPRCDRAVERIPNERELDRFHVH